MTEIIMNDGAATFTKDIGTTSHQVNPSPAPVASGVITQGRTSSGSPILNGALTTNSIINVGGAETSVKAALAAGLIQANADGSFSMVSAEAQAQAQQQREKAKAQAEAEAL